MRWNRQASGRLVWRRRQGCRGFGRARKVPTVPLRWRYGLWRSSAVTNFIDLKRAPLTSPPWSGIVSPLVALFLIKGIVKLEVQRRENSKKCKALILQMADMMGALLQLHYVRDPELVDERGESIAGRIQVLMKHIEQDIKNCGNLIDTYSKHSIASE